TQVAIVQITEKNKEGACPHINNKKRKAEELEERKANRKMLKVKKETSQNVLVKINNSYENNTLQKIEQMNMDIQTTPVVDNEDSNKQSWAEMIDNDSDNLKNITNATNSWVTPSTNEISIEYTNTENSILHNNQEGTRLGIESSTSTNGKIVTAQEPIWYFNHKLENMQAEVTQQEAMAKLAKVAINVKSTHDVKVGTLSGSGNQSNKEIVVEPSDTTKVAKEEDTYKEAVKTPTNTGTSPDEEMVAELSDPLRNELSNLYGTTENKKNLPPVAATKDINIEDVQASMFLQVSNAKMDDFKV
ncbi:10193_t:CDS:2, partial [Gigaspora margarita]